MPGVGWEQLFSDAGLVLYSELGQGNSSAFSASDLLLAERGGFVIEIEGMEGVKNILFPLDCELSELW